MPAQWSNELVPSAATPPMRPIKLEDAASLLSALPFGTVQTVSTVGSPAHHCYTKCKQKNKQNKNFHTIAPFLTIHVFVNL